MAKRPLPEAFPAHSLILHPDQVNITDLTVDSEW